MSKLSIRAHAVISQFSKVIVVLFLPVTGEKNKKVTFLFFRDFLISPKDLSQNISKPAPIAAYAKNEIF